jgi:hypothetical protein
MLTFTALTLRIVSTMALYAVSPFNLLYQFQLLMFTKVFSHNLL